MPAPAIKPDDTDVTACENRSYCALSSRGSGSDSLPFLRKNVDFATHRLTNRNGGRDPKNPCTRPLEPQQRVLIHLTKPILLATATHTKKSRWIELEFDWQQPTHSVIHRGPSPRDFSPLRVPLGPVKNTGWNCQVPQDSIVRERRLDCKHQTED